MREKEMAELMFRKIPMILLLMGAFRSESLAVEAAAFPNATLTKPNCDGTCGNVTIPFPFGIGAGCYLDEWYEILCEVNHTVPRLKKLGLMVLNISFHEQRFFFTESALTISYPITYSTSGCNRNESHTPVSLQGSPFTFSTRNKFVAVGCGDVSIMQIDADPSFVGCKTECTGTHTRRISACDGYDCCRSAIPGDLQGFHIDLRPANKSGTSGGVQDCQFGLLVFDDWFRPNKTDLYSLQDQDYVPVVLDFGLLDESLPESLDIMVDWPMLGTVIPPAACRTAGYINGNSTPIFSCTCNDGFIGNPYLLDGCKNVNECEIPEYSSCMQRNCVDIPGNYYCADISKRNFTPLIAGISSSFGSLVSIFLTWWMYKVIKKRRETKLKEKFFKRNGGLVLKRQLSSPNGNIENSKLFDSNVLEKATDHFTTDRILGKGGQGTVYKGMLTDGRIVAVKRSIGIDEKNAESFINEVVILSQINHRNIVKLLGCCLESEVPLLVYEFIPNGNLYEYLHEPEFPISWEARLRIAGEVAGALFYLHSFASIPIYHRDIKSSNILLDDKYRAKIADFGTSRSVALDQTHVTTLVKGTFGYLDPEYFRSGQFTDKSDVYSFGVILVELLTGRKPTSSLIADNSIGLASSFIISMEEDRLFEILDPQVQEQGGEEEIMLVANLAKRCLNLKGRKRPTMKEIVMELEGIQNRSRPDSSLVESQEKADHAEAKEFEASDSSSEYGGSEDGSDTIMLFDGHPLLTSDTIKSFVVTASSM